ncbi:MAG: ABC transporter ATP-binding protein/permease [Clostridiales bacterium]|nr:ABC transporter ATP-binding protein/permease [Clostridiales bacterium]
MQGAKLHLTGKLLRQNKWYFLAALACTIMTVVIEFITPIGLAETLDYYLQGKPSRMPAFVNAWVDSLGGREFMANNLWIVGLALVALNLLSGVFSFCKSRTQAIAGENVSLTLRERLYAHIQRLPFSYHVKAETGDLVQRCTSDVETVRRFLAMQLMQVVNAVLMIGTALFYLLRENMRITLISMVLVPALFLFAWLFFKMVIKNFKLADEAEGKMSAVLQENLTGVRVVRAFGQQEYEVEKFERANGELRRKNQRICNLLAVYWATSDAISMIQSMVTLIVCVFAAIQGEITVGTLIIFTTYVWKLLWPIRQLGRILSDAGKSSVAMGRIEEILVLPEEPAEPNAVRPSLRGDIVFDHVSFHYDEGPDVLRDLSCVIPAGKTVAILGATGSGKSSMVQLLQRLFEPQSGEIRIGGTNINKIDRQYLRSHIGLVLQEPFLYSKTLRDNVKIAVSDATEEAIDQAVNDAAAKNFILASDKGFETLVGERGVTLSGGQKQRIAIARTLMKDNDVLIFDDSLSAVDTETDAMIRAALKKHSRETTTIIISHRVVTLSQADLILVLENGHITEQGSHEQLMHSGGLYSKIFNIQTALEEEFKEEKNNAAV